MNVSFPLRKECPPGACICDRDALLNDPDADVRILQLTKEEERKLVARLEGIASFEELRRMQERMHALLGIAMRITPAASEVRTVRGLSIQLVEQRGLCRKTQEAIPAAIRRCLDRNPEIIYAILDSHDLLGGASAGPL